MKEVAEEIHEFGFGFIIFFIVAHMGGLIVHTIHDRGALLFSMLHGKRYLQKRDTEV